MYSHTGRGAAWLARLTGGQEVAGSNPVAPIFARKRAKIEQVSTGTGEQVKRQSLGHVVRSSVDGLTCGLLLN